MINTIKLYTGGYTVKYIEGTNHSINGVLADSEDEAVKEWLLTNTPEPEFTDAELLQQIEDAKPKVVTMRQARLALLQSGLLATVTDAIVNGTDEALKIEWEYATDVRREWTNLIALATSLNMTSVDLDNLFQLASTL